MRTLIILPLAAMAVIGMPLDSNPEDDTGKDLVLVDFGRPGGGRWYVIDDGVMGGVSRGSFSRSDEGTAVFAGDLSLDNDGGFSSVRTNLGPLDLTGHAGIEVRVRGDGRTYQLRLRTDDRFDGPAYRAFFATREGEWTSVRVPFDDFAATFRGRIIAEAPPLDTGRIRQLGFLLADQRAGPFRLEIGRVSAWAAVEPAR